MPFSESQERRRQLLFSLAISLICWGVLAGAYLNGSSRKLDLMVRDGWFRLRGERAASDSLAIITVDDETIRAYRGAWPLPRETYALLIDVLRQAGASVIGFDVYFPRDKAFASPSDSLLAYLSGEARVVHALKFHSESRTEAGEPPIDSLALAAIRNHGIAPDHIPAAYARAMSPVYTLLAQEAHAFGHITVASDEDGAIRRQPLLVRYENRVYPSLALQMIGVARGADTAPEASRVGQDLRVGWRHAGSWRVQVDEDQATSIDLAGLRSAFPHRHSMLEVLQRHGDPAWLRENFANRVVLVGVDSREEVTEDVGTTPFSAITPLVYLHANVLDNLLRGRFLSRPGTGPYLGALLILALSFGWIFSARSVLATAGLAVLALLVIAVADFALFAGWALDVPPMAMLALAPLVYVSTGSFRYVFLETRTRERERDLREGRLVQQELLPESLVGQTLSHYEVMAKLGGGAFGIVYRGRDRRLNRDVAIKVLRGRALANDKMRRRFRHEALALSRLSHPHIAAIYDFDSQDGLDFIAMEYVTGTPLSLRIERGALPEREALVIAVQVAEALVQAHAQGVIHRDLKPANVVLTAQGSAKVLDFGLAHLARTVTDSATVSESLTETNQVMGTLPYMAPELLRGQRATELSDVYALGVLLYEALTGRRPFHEPDPHEMYYAILTFRPPAPRVLNAKISEAAESLVLQAMEKEAPSRVPSAAELLARLRALVKAPSGRSLVS